MKNTKIDELQKQLDEVTNNWKRALADYQNLEKRTREEKTDFSQYANQNLILKLLPVLDTFEKLAEHLKDENIVLSLKQFRDVLNNEGLEKIEAIGKDFNPEEMECVEAVQGEDGKVIEETRSGYKLKGKIIRPAMVKVGKKNIN